MDDGSGEAIELIYFDDKPGLINTGRFARPEGAQPIDFRKIDFSTVVKAKGQIDEYRGMRQIKLLKIGRHILDLLETKIHSVLIIE